MASEGDEELAEWRMDVKVHLVAQILSGILAR
jgi:hypothetical protein